MVLSDAFRIYNEVTVDLCFDTVTMLYFQQYKQAYKMQFNRIPVIHDY